MIAASGSASASAGISMWLSRSRVRSKRSRSDAFEQIELGDEGQLEARRDAAGDLEDRQQHAEQQDEAPGPTGNRGWRARRRWRRRCRPRPPCRARARRRPPACRRARRAMSSATMQSSSVAGSRFEHQAEHVLPQRDRGAEIAVQHAGQPDEELLEHRLVEAVERAQPVDVGLAGAGRQHHGDRIAGRDADHHEDHDRHAEQRDRPSSASGSGTVAAATFGKHAIASRREVSGFSDMRR